MTDEHQRDQWNQAVNAMLDHVSVFDLEDPEASARAVPALQERLRCIDPVYPALAGVQLVQTLLRAISFTSLPGSILERRALRRTPGLPRPRRHRRSHRPPLQGRPGHRQERTGSPAGPCNRHKARWPPPPTSRPETRSGTPGRGRLMRRRL